VSNAILRQQDDSSKTSQQMRWPTGPTQHAIPLVISQFITTKYETTSF